ncbi:Hypp3383 [Branchiostoma lanceolatum]|uniref:Hypp3383 protein n=1 Tax=Branchiostoma lanceolatum TaxID=7740 RepID=A0A8K0A012_BRALA|nr:Hypp3383 [Branchiostoma lanceolatum]
MLLLSAMSVQTGPVCRCEDKDTYKEFLVNINERGVGFTQKVEVDEDNNVVIFHVPTHNQVINNQVMMDYTTNHQMTFFPDKRACLLATIPREMPPLQKLVQGLQNFQSPRSRLMKNKVEETYVRVLPEPLLDRTVLSDKMAQFCARYPVYRLEAIPMPVIGPFVVDSPVVQTSDENSTSDNHVPDKESRIVVYDCGSNGEQLGWRCEEQTSGCIYVYECEAVDDRPWQEPTKFECTNQHLFTGAGWECTPSCV